MPAVLPTHPIRAIQVASWPAAGFLNTHHKIYKNPASPYTNVMMDKIRELFIVYLYFAEIVPKSSLNA
jgi:hypothetical protein